MEVIHEAPLESSFVPLSEHQSHTPASFYSGPPVLHYRSPGASLLVAKTEVEGNPAISKLLDSPQANGTAAGDDDEQDVVISGVDVWVTSEKFVLYRHATSAGVSIPYQSISLHAIQRLQNPAGTDQVQGLYLQLVVSDGFDDHDPDGSMSLALIPANSAPVPPSNTDGSSLENAETSHIQQLFAAVSACANLHPDPVSPSSSQEDVNEDDDMPAFEYQAGDVSGGLPPPMPGSRGWITAENMDQFFDEDGNWRGEGLGPGAGIVRERDEDDEQVNGNGEDEDGTDETKWRRTG